MRTLITAAAALAFFGQPALASQTACVFSAGQAPHYYELEFIGYGDAQPMIVFSSTAFGAGKRFTLKPENYSLRNFNPKAGTVNLEFRNPGDSSLPPSFGLDGADGRALFKTGSVIIGGNLKCER